MADVPDNLDLLLADECQDRTMENLHDIGGHDYHDGENRQ